LTLEDNFSYHSVPEGQGFIVEPPWEIPHVALFYCSDNDDLEARRTMTTARKFMSRHGVPSIVISHKQLFDRGQCMALDQHSIHMCLESRDPNGRGNVIHRRLPIDLASFLNIDARQMNRNLAYLTGLHEPLENSTPSVVPTTTEKTLVNPQDLEKTSYSISDSVNFIRNRNGAEWRALLPVGMLLLSVFAAVLTGIPSYRFSNAPAISINSKVMSAVPISTATSVLSSLAPSITSTSTSIAVKTSTKTITITHAQSSGTNSLAVMPSMELGKANPASQNKAQNKSQVCSAEILGDREILIRIPSTTKLSWLTKEALSVNITRGNVTVDTERAYSSDEGIVLLLAKNQAYGVLNISIVTTKKPRVNETFQVDFGTLAGQTWQSLVNKLSSIFAEEANIITDPQTYEQMRNMMDKMVEDARAQSHSTFIQMEEARKIAMQHATSTGARLTQFAQSISLEAAKRSAIISKELGIQLSEAESKISKKLQSLEHLREPLDTGLMRAQVQSKLLWLKLQGKSAEYEEYEKRAADASRARAADWKKWRKDTGEHKRKSCRASIKKAAKREARAGRKSERKGRT
jgi:acetolactate synthase small subunit